MRGGEESKGGSPSLEHNHLPSGKVALSLPSFFFFSLEMSRERGKERCPGRVEVEAHPDFSREEDMLSGCPMKGSCFRPANSWQSQCYTRPSHSLSPLFTAWLHVSPYCLLLCLLGAGKVLIDLTLVLILPIDSGSSPSPSSWDGKCQI
jgi:hypothetical protein